MGIFHKENSKLPTIKEDLDEGILENTTRLALRQAKSEILILFDEILRLKSENTKLELEKYNLNNTLRDVQNDLEDLNIKYYNEVNENNRLKLELELEFYKKEVKILEDINNLYEDINNISEDINKL